MTIQNSIKEDIGTIFQLYDAATDLQKKLAPKHWKGFDRKLIEKEIDEKRHWKIMDEGQLACTFATTFNDAVIWGEKNDQPALYIHRIATHHDFRGRSYVNRIVEWAEEFARANGKDFIRMDTGSGNQRLNDYYIRCGFEYLGIVQMGDAGDLPEHYQNGSFSLFEMQVGEGS